MTVPLAARHFYHRRNVAVVMIGSRTQFAVDHFADGRRSMATAHNAFTLIRRLVHALVAIPADRRNRKDQNLPSGLVKGVPRNASR